MSEQRLIVVSPENIFRLDADTYPDRMYACGWNGMVHVIEELPTIDPETLPIVQELRVKLAECEQVRAHWETVPNREVEHGEVEIRGTAEMCSACKHADKYFRKWFEYCPNCGVKMEMEEEETE